MVFGRVGGVRKGWWCSEGLVVFGRVGGVRKGWWCSEGLVVFGRVGGACGTFVFEGVFIQRDRVKPILSCSFS